MYMYVGHDHSSQGIEGQGQPLTLALTLVQNWTPSVSIHQATVGRQHTATKSVLVVK